MNLLKNKVGLNLNVHARKSIYDKPIIDFYDGETQELVYNFYKEDFAEKLNKLDKSKPYAIYCRSGHRSGLTAKKMEEIGFKSTVNLDGGILQWIEEGMKVFK